jgi:hypothetical protein
LGKDCIVTVIQNRAEEKRKRAELQLFRKEKHFRNNGSEKGNRIAISLNQGLFLCRHGRE